MKKRADWLPGAAQPRREVNVFNVGDKVSTHSSADPGERLCCGISLDPREPVQQPGVVLAVASRLDQMYIPSPRILRCFPTVKLRMATGEAEIAALGMAVGRYITPPFMGYRLRYDRCQDRVTWHRGERSGLSKDPYSIRMKHRGELFHVDEGPGWAG